MKPPVSLDYLIVMVMLAGAAAALSFLAPHPAYNLTALMLGVYAMHLVSLRVVVRQYAGVTGSRGRARKKRGVEDEPDVYEIRELREQLESDRRELENRKVELQQRITAAEEQWELLRQMIRDRVGEGGGLPESVGAGTQSAWKTQQPTQESRGNGPDSQPRIHGRW